MSTSSRGKESEFRIPADDQSILDPKYADLRFENEHVLKCFKSYLAHKCRICLNRFVNRLCFLYLYKKWYKNKKLKRIIYSGTTIVSFRALERFNSTWLKRIRSLSVFCVTRT